MVVKSSSMFNRINNKDCRVLIVADMKGAVEYFSTGGGKDGVPWRRLCSRFPSVDTASLDQILDVVLGPKDEPPDDRRELALVHKEAQWVVHAYDCRKEQQHSKTISTMKKHMTGISPKSVPWTFRLCHSNEEFSTKHGLHTCASERNSKFTNGKVAPRPLGQLSLPDPLESVAVLTSLKYAVDRNPRRFIDVPGTPTTRGLSGVPMRQGYGDGKRLEHNAWVTLQTAREIMKGCVVAKPGDHVDDEDEEGGNNGADDEHVDTALDIGTASVPLVPWAKSESLCQEMINVFRPTHQIIMACGEGEDLLAGVRDKVPTLCMVRSHTHAEVVKQHVLATMISEHMDSVDDGFLQAVAAP